MARKLVVEIIGDASSLERAYGKAGSQTKTFGGQINKLGKAAAFTAGGAALGALTIAVRDGAQEFKEQQLVAAQTAQVIKTTGGAAHVTAKQVDELSKSLLNKTGIDDEAIKSSANLLLGFTKIRNEVGKGNDIFNQATKTLLDFSVRTGRDASSAAIILGKALNDPVLGMTLLRRVGIQFTDAQKEQINALVKAGDTMGAQKIILAELTKRYGGAAEAAGKTLPGQLNILNQKLHNLEGDAFAKAIKQAQEFAPAVLNIVKAVEKLSPVLTPLTKLFYEVFITPMRVTADLITGKWGKAWKDFSAPVRHAIEAARAILGPFIDQVGKLVGLIDGLVHGTSRATLQGEATRKAAQGLAQRAVGQLGGALGPLVPPPHAGGRSNGAVVFNGPVNVHGVADPDQFIVWAQRTARKQSPSRSGPFAGHNLGLT